MNILLWPSFHGIGVFLKSYRIFKQKRYHLRSNQQRWMAQIVKRQQQQCQGILTSRKLNRSKEQKLSIHKRYSKYYVTIKSLFRYEIKSYKHTHANISDLSIDFLQVSFSFTTIDARKEKNKEKMKQSFCSIERRKILSTTVSIIYWVIEKMILCQYHQLSFVYFLVRNIRKFNIIQYHLDTVHTKLNWYNALIQNNFRQ